MSLALFATPVRTFLVCLALALVLALVFVATGSSALKAATIGFVAAVALGTWVAALAAWRHHRRP